MQVVVRCCTSMKSNQKDPSLHRMNIQEEIEKRRRRAIPRTFCDYLLPLLLMMVSWAVSRRKSWCSFSRGAIQNLSEHKGTNSGGMKENKKNHVINKMQEQLPVLPFHMCIRGRPFGQYSDGSWGHFPLNFTYLYHFVSKVLISFLLLQRNVTLFTASLCWSDD